MTCPLGHADDRRAGTTTITLTRGDATIVIRHVPALVCATCGDATLDRETAGALEQFAGQAIASGVKVLVREFSSVAA